MKDTRDFVLLLEAYLQLLNLSHGVSRMRLQSALACLRDEIADISGWNAERVQHHCEAMVALRNTKGVS